MSIPRLQPLVAAPRRVAVHAIDRELKSLWRATEVETGGGIPPGESAEAGAGTAPGESGQARGDSPGAGRPGSITRVVTLTLVAYAATRDDGERLSRVIARVSERHPARAILVVNHPTPDGLEAWVTAHSHPIGRVNRQLLSEQITIVAAPSAHARVPSVVRHLTLPDMPVFLYWPAAVTWNGLLSDLLDVADRIILDSAAFADGAGDLIATARSGTGPSPLVRISDLNWGRLTGWRSLTAQFFDPPRTHWLDRLSRLRVTHAAASRAQALLYVAWLAARLGWRTDHPLDAGAATGGPWRGTVVGPTGHPIALSLHPDPTSSQGDGALLLTLLVAGNTEATFLLARKDDGNAVMAVSETETGAPLRRVVPLEVPDEVSLLSAELDVVGRDGVYEETLRALPGILGVG